MQIYADYSGRLDPNCFTSGRDGGHPVLVLVCHNTAGPNDYQVSDPATAQALSDAAAHYLTSNDRQVSVHWLVGAEAAGAPIYSIVPETSIAYHCGGSPGYPSSWRNPDDSAVYGRYGLNQISIGIELYGQVGDVLGPNQTASLQSLVKDIVGRYPILAKPGHIVSHASLEADRADGRNWVAQAAAWARQQPLPSTGLDVTDYANPGNVWHCVATDKWVTNDQGFLAYHRQHGGIATYGLPITGAYSDPAQPGQVVQWFERARFEYHTADGQVYLGLIGAELLSRLPK